MRRAVLGVPLVVAGLAGCISLLPKTPPVQLYRFGDDGGAALPPRSDASPRVGVALVQLSLPHATRGDGLLTATGDQAAYIGGARWASPAAVLFQEDAGRAFDERARRTRLLDRGDTAAADALLRLDVIRFEARYDPGAPTAAPTVRVAVRATLSRPDGSQLLQGVFSHDAAAGENRVAAIVAAYDQAVDATLQDLVAWTDRNAPAHPPSAAEGATVIRSTSATEVRPAS